MNRKEMLLTLIAEECNEVGQRASKAIRFGLDEVEEGQSLNNAERIVYEFNDLMAVMEMLREDYDFPKIKNYNMILEKKAKVEKWLEYSKSVGTLTD